MTLEQDHLAPVGNIEQIFYVRKMNPPNRERVRGKTFRTFEFRPWVECARWTGTKFFAKSVILNSHHVMHSIEKLSSLSLSLYSLSLSHTHLCKQIFECLLDFLQLSTYSRASFVRGRIISTLKKEEKEVRKERKEREGKGRGEREREQEWGGRKVGRYFTELWMS